MTVADDWFDDGTLTMLICVDCAMVHANADSSGIESEERLSEVMRGLERFPVLAVLEPEGFSWSPCGACGSVLGGDRFRAKDMWPFADRSIGDTGVHDEGAGDEGDY
jgi:hypothetical protein